MAGPAVAVPQGGPPGSSPLYRVALWSLSPFRPSLLSSVAHLMTSLPRARPVSTHLHASVMRSHLLRWCAVLGCRDIGVARHADAGAAAAGQRARSARPPAPGRP